MKIVADKEGMQAINQLLDIALKGGGLSNLSQINQIANSCRLEKPLDLMAAIVENPGIQKELDAILESARVVDASVKCEREMETTSAPVKPLKETNPGEEEK